jgi:hypothetical protein
MIYSQEARPALGHELGPNGARSKERFSDEL